MARDLGAREYLECSAVLSHGDVKELFKKVINILGGTTDSEVRGKNPLWIIKSVNTNILEGKDNNDLLVSFSKSQDGDVEDVCSIQGATGMCLKAPQLCKTRNVMEGTKTP